MGSAYNRRLEFTDGGIVVGTGTRKLPEVVARNMIDLNGRFVGMTRRDMLRD